jgi:hypothetical protein
MTTIEALVDRFLAWKVPPTFGPDGGITFKPSNGMSREQAYAQPGWWPIGTNLFTATEARQMLEHLLGTPTRTWCIAKQHPERAEVSMFTTSSEHAAKEYERLGWTVREVGALPADVPEARRPLGCALAMRVLQSDLYPTLDGAERADCDELVHRNLEWAKRDELTLEQVASGVTSCALPQPWQALIEEAVAAFAEGDPLSDRLPNAMAALRAALTDGVPVSSNDQPKGGA